MDRREKRTLDTLSETRVYAMREKNDAPGDGAMECATFENASKVGLCRSLFVGMDKGEKRISDE